MIKKGKAWKQEDLIDALNPIITRWTNYHQSVVSKGTFSKLDHTVWNMLWGWVKRRHPKKSRSWTANRSFPGIVLIDILKIDTLLFNVEFLIITSYFYNVGVYSL